MLTSRGLAILSAVPALMLGHFVFIGLPIVFFAGAASTLLGSLHESAFPAIWCLGAEVGLYVWAIGLFVLHARRSAALDRTARELWIAALLLAGPIMTLPYWIGVVSADGRPTRAGSVDAGTARWLGVLSVVPPVAAVAAVVVPLAIGEAAGDAGLYPAFGAMLLMLAVIVVLTGVFAVHAVQHVAEGRQAVWALLILFLWPVGPFAYWLSVVRPAAAPRYA